MIIDPDFYNALMNASQFDYHRALNNNPGEIRLVVTEFYDRMKEPFITIDDYRTTHHQSLLYKIISSDDHNRKLWKDLDEHVESKFFTHEEDLYNVFSALCYLDNICDDYILRSDVIEYFFKPDVRLMKGYEIDEIEWINNGIQNKTDLLVDQFLNNFRFEENVVIDLGRGHDWKLFEKNGVVNVHNFDRIVVKDLWFSYLFYSTMANYSRNVDFDGNIYRFMKSRMFFRCCSLSWSKITYLERLGLIR